MAIEDFKRVAIAIAEISKKEKGDEVEPSFLDSEETQVLVDLDFLEYVYYDKQDNAVITSFELHQKIMGCLEDNFSIDYKLVVA